jgi:hypothetical protein
VALTAPNGKWAGQHFTSTSSALSIDPPAFIGICLPGPTEDAEGDRDEEIAMTLLAVKDAFTGWLGFAGVGVVLILVIVWLASRKS